MLLSTEDSNTATKIYFILLKEEFLVVVLSSVSLVLSDNTDLTQLNLHTAVQFDDYT